MHSSRSRFAASACALFASANIAGAQQTCGTDLIPLQTTNWSNSVSIPNQVAITLTRPNNTVIVAAVPVQQFMDNLTSFDSTIDFGGTTPRGNLPPLSNSLGASAGDTSYFQYCYRNPNGPCQNGNTNTTNALEVTWGL